MSVRKHIKKKYSPEEWVKIEEEADIFVAGLQSLQNSVSNELKRIMEKEGLGYREIGRMLGITDTMTSKLLNGGNVNFETITKISILNHRIPAIVWLPKDEDEKDGTEKKPNAS